MGIKRMSRLFPRRLKPIVSLRPAYIKTLFQMLVALFYTGVFWFFIPAALAGGLEAIVLKNGLKVYLIEEHKAPVVTFQIWYKVGSRNEVSGKTGLSHLTEHMMFKGTPQYGKGEFSRTVAKNGGTENAFTGNDYTAYFENFSSDRLHLSLDLESDRMQNLLIDPREFQLELAVVKEERRTRTEDDPYAALIENLYALAFYVHPYHLPVIGWMNDLNNLTRSDVYSHYKQYYVPNNATLVVVGDFQPEWLLAKIKEKFESIPRGPDPAQTVSAELQQLGERRMVLKREAALSFIFAGYPTPNHRHIDSYPLAVLAKIFSSGKSSRLYQKLVYEQQIALDAGGHYEGMTADPDLFYLYATARPEKSTADLEKAVYAEIDRLQTEPVTDHELQKAKNQIESEHLMGADSNFYRAMQIGMAETVGAGADYVETFLDHIRQVTPGDIMRVAKTYLIEDHRSVGTLLPTPPNESHPPTGSR